MRAWSESGAPGRKIQCSRFEVLIRVEIDDWAGGWEQIIRKRQREHRGWSYLNSTRLLLSTGGEMGTLRVIFCNFPPLPEGVILLDVLNCRPGWVQTFESLAQVARIEQLGGKVHPGRVSLPSDESLRRMALLVGGTAEAWRWKVQHPLAFPALMLFKTGLPSGTCSMAVLPLWPHPALYSWAQTGITYPFYDVALIRRSKEIDADLGFIWEHWSEGCAAQGKRKQRWRIRNEAVLNDFFFLEEW